MKLRTYILFIFGMFEDHEDIEFFCTEVLDESPVIKQVRFVIENSQNVIVIFDSMDEYKKIAEELFKDNGNTSGTFDVAGNHIAWSSNGGTISLSITDPAGKVTQVDVPYGSLAW